MVRESRICTCCICCALISMVAAARLAAAEGKAPRFSGYIKSAFSEDTDGISTMKVTNARIKLSGAIDEKTSYGIFFDAIRDDILLDAYITRTIVPAVELKVGQFKTPYSTDNLVAGWKYPFLRRGYLKSKTTPFFRDIGVQVSHRSKYIELYTGIMNGSGANKAETNNNKSVSCRAVAHLPLQMNLSGNYSRAEITGDGEVTAFYDAGVDGLMSGALYAAEYAAKTYLDRTAHVAAAWISYDYKTDFGPVSVLSPAVKCEYYDPDVDLDDDAMTRYTVGISGHFGKKYTNRVMLNYEREENELQDANDRIGVDYMIRY